MGYGLWVGRTDWLSAKCKGSWLHWMGEGRGGDGTGTGPVGANAHWHWERCSGGRCRAVVLPGPYSLHQSTTVWTTLLSCVPFRLGAETNRGASE